MLFKSDQVITEQQSKTLCHANDVLSYPSVVFIVLELLNFICDCHAEEYDDTLLKNHSSKNFLDWFIVTRWAFTPILCVSPRLWQRSNRTRSNTDTSSDLQATFHKEFKKKTSCQTPLKLADPTEHQLDKVDLPFVFSCHKKESFARRNGIDVYHFVAVLSVSGECLEGV